ncbi:MAG: cell division protein ZapE [Betaproteobacteria bacterium]
MTSADASSGDDLASQFDAELAQRHASADASQRIARDRLLRLAGELSRFRIARLSTLKRLFAPPDVPRGMYLWGGVGRGKSMLMDAFYAIVPVRRKTRVHFHAFMRAVHAELATLAHAEDPLATVAARIARRWRLVCFDEFHVSDVADAMILGRLLEHLFNAGVVLVMTSNYEPATLWPQGLNRQRFLATIALLREWLEVTEVDGGIDYRLRTLSQVQSYFVPAGPVADAAITGAFDRLAECADEDPVLDIDGRRLVARRRAGSAAWFDFTTLCDGPRSQRDYLDIAQRFGIVLLSGVPRMGADSGDRARRFTWLVDILYDHRVKLIVSAAVPAAELHVEGPHAAEFARTVSRLAEMRSRDYMALAHARDDPLVARAAAVA